MTTAIEPVALVPPRKSLTKAQRARVFDAGSGTCYFCNQPIKRGEKWEAEHPAFRAGGGSDKVEDLKPAHVDCHKPKTAADRKVLAKTQRTRAAHLGIEGRPTVLSGRNRQEIDRDKNVRAKARGGGKPSLPPRALFRDARP